MGGNIYWIILTTCCQQNEELSFCGDINPTEITPVDKSKKYICRSNVFQKTYPTGIVLSTFSLAHKPPSNLYTVHRLLVPQK